MSEEWKAQEIKALQPTSPAFGSEAGIEECSALTKHSFLIHGQRYSLSQYLIPNSLKKVGKPTMDPQKASPKLMAPCLVKGEIIYEFRSVSMWLVEQHSILSLLPSMKHRYGWLPDG